MDYVFNLVGIKCSPKVTMEQPFDIMGPMMQFNTNMIEAALTTPSVKWFLYTSTVGVYTPAEIFYEDDVWNGYPSRNDWYGGWAKRMGELQCEAYEKQHGEGKCSIVRPANVYGPYDNFDPKNAMVVPSLIRKAYENDIIEVWGNGQQTRSFLYVDECVEAVLRLMESDFTGPVNIGSEEMVTINQLAELVIQISGKDLSIKNIDGDEFIKKYGFKCTLGVKGRNSDNKLYREKIGWEVSQPLSVGITKTFIWIKSQVDTFEKETLWIYESPDGGKTTYKREPLKIERIKIN
jgi:nucleoside-diphosphate-sugar epimerase